MVQPDTQETVVIPGLYVTGIRKDLFITDTVPDTGLAAFLDQKNITVVHARE
jgi:hypothetical protein